MARGRSFLGFGNSSAMCVTPSGVPMVKAPLSTPVRNATPLPQPVVLFQSDHTKELLACCLGIAAITMIVTIPPTITWRRSKNLCAESVAAIFTTNNPNFCRAGKNLLRNTVAAMQSHVIPINEIKIWIG